MLLDVDNSSFILYCDTQELSKDKRFLLSLKRLKPVVSVDNFAISFNQWEQINILGNIESILKKFEIHFDISDKINEIFSDYKREVDNFWRFSENAQKIRDNQFKDNPELVEMFVDFQDVLSRNMSRKLYDLQILSAFHMAFAQNSCNFAVPWAWKTTIVYGAYTYLKNLPTSDPRHVDKLLVIWPLSSFQPWEEQYFKCYWVHIAATRLSGNQDLTKNQKIQHLYSGNPSEVTLINHWYVNALEKEIRDFLSKNKTMVVVDEAHRIKNSRWIWGTSVTEISKDAISRVVLTWTPIPNGYEDLFNLYKFIYPFKYPEILKIHLQQLEEMTRNADDESPRVKEFIKNISPYFIRIKKSDLRLPRTDEKSILVTMDDVQQEVYDFIAIKFLNSFKENPWWTLKDLLNKAKLVRMRQAAINPWLLNSTLKESLNEEEYEENYKNIPDEFQGDSAIRNKITSYLDKYIPPKFLKALDIIKTDILPHNGKVIIWTIFIQNAKWLQKYLESEWIKSKILIWEVPMEEREEVIQKFNNPENKDFSVVIANPFSVAESISLHEWCHNAIYLERDYNCSNFLQSKDRIHRVWLHPNQITTYYYLITRDTVDEIINDKLNQKIKRMEKLIDADIPLFFRINESDESDIIKELLKRYASKS